MSITLFDPCGAPMQTWSFRIAYPVKWTGSTSMPAATSS